MVRTKKYSSIGRLTLKKHDVDFNHFGCSTSRLFYIQPAKTRKSNTGGVTFIEVALKVQCLYTQMYSPPHCFFCSFVGWGGATSFKGYITCSFIYDNKNGFYVLLWFCYFCYFLLFFRRGDVKHLVLSVEQSYDHNSSYYWNRRYCTGFPSSFLDLAKSLYGIWNVVITIIMLYSINLFLNIL